MSNATKPFSLDRKLAVGFGAAVLVLLMINAVAWWNAARFREAYREDFRGVVSEMSAEERRRLDRQLDRAELFGRLTVGLTVAASLVAIGIVALAASRVRRESTDRKRAETERDRFFTISRELLCIADFAGHVTRLNPSWECILGFTPEELMARPFIEFVHPDDQENTRAETARLSSGAESVGFENRFRCKDGSYRWLSWSARALLHEKSIYASARDVTESKVAEKCIQNLNADLAQRAGQIEAANRELESFSYSVSHDLRAPLRHIDGFASLLTKHATATLDAEGRRFVGIISKSAKQMGILIDDLLEFSRIGRAPFKRERVKHDQLVAGVIADGRYDANGRVIAWEITSLPDVLADLPMLRKVWTNLIDNAVKYSSKAPESRITLGGREDSAAGEYVFFVRDNGVGFDMAYADKLFGVFQRLHGPAEFEGTGIGLANVRRIVTRHGGRTWAEGRVGEGATFYFSLPFNVPALAAST